MPNHCSNSLHIRARTPEELQAFLSQVKGKDEDGEQPFLLNSLFPCPPELIEKLAPCAPDAELVAKYGHSNWYDWRVANWGTKWDCYDVCLEVQDDIRAEIFFTSAWSPPVEWLKEVAPRFPNLRFNLSYREEGCGFEGDTYAYREEFHDDCRNIGYSHDEEFESDDWTEQE